MDVPAVRLPSVLREGRIIERAKMGTGAWTGGRSVGRATTSAMSITTKRRDRGDCRRRAPTDKKWPTVGMHSWCGEFVRWDKEVIPYDDVAYASERERAEIRDNTGVADEELFLRMWQPTPRKVKPSTQPGSPAKGEGE